MHQAICKPFEAERAANKGLINAMKEILVASSNAENHGAIGGGAVPYPGCFVLIVGLHHAINCRRCVPCDGCAVPSAYQEAGNYVGTMFAMYGGVSAIAAFILPWLAKFTSRKLGI